jgi:hypothetical protein
MLSRLLCLLRPHHTSAGYENRLGKIEADLLVLKWMVATNVMLTVGVLIRLLWLRP